MVEVVFSSTYNNFSGSTCIFFLRLIVNQGTMLVRKSAPRKGNGLKCSADQPAASASSVCGNPLRVEEPFETFVARKCRGSLRFCSSL